MAGKLVAEFGGDIRHAKIVAESMTSPGNSIGIEKTEKFWRTFVLRSADSIDGTGGYTLGELADLLGQDYWCGQMARHEFDSIFEELPEGSIRVRLSEDKTYLRTPFVVGIKNSEGMESWKYFQNASGFIKVKEIPNKPKFLDEREYRKLQDLVKDCEDAFQSTASGSETHKSTVTTGSISPNDCIVCMDNARDTLLLPCSHLHFCGECAARLERCPLCKVIITERKGVFL